MQVLGWVLNRGCLRRPLTPAQFLAVYALPIIPAEGGLDGSPSYVCALPFAFPRPRPPGLGANPPTLSPRRACAAPEPIPPAESSTSTSATEQAAEREAAASQAKARRKGRTHETYSGEGPAQGRLGDAQTQSGEGHAPSLGGQLLLLVGAIGNPSCGY